MMYVNKMDRKRAIDKRSKDMAGHILFSLSCVFSGSQGRIWEVTSCFCSFTKWSVPFHPWLKAYRSMRQGLRLAGQQPVKAQDDKAKELGGRTVRCARTVRALCESWLFSTTGSSVSSED